MRDTFIILTVTCSAGLSQWFEENEGHTFWSVIPVSGPGYKGLDYNYFPQRIEGVTQGITGSQTLFLRLEKHTAVLLPMT